METRPNIVNATLREGWLWHAISKVCKKLEIFTKILQAYIFCEYITHITKDKQNKKFWKVIKSEKDLLAYM